ncbi:hypothetical protein [Anaerocolumna xylanovorans]|uniref:Methyltransferase domain-containing protein n=1 Tax=Anaerocolumna xylanovorans DSM 12503 TaxID=1121345 RepID=A0A1M7Y0J5_9FIRM|nr:hypothetical protein [Anaerocolumna xylanovorans]SHO45143.1 hypothetical protein SAMN02745217_00840 [Anaerocolumna xylanovorans DSM 12503]
MNPWLTIDLPDYENHMCHASVCGLQALNEMMDSQINKYDVKTAMILGIAEVNGLNHINPDKFEKVYGVDINSNYLALCLERYKNLSGIFEPLHIDLTQNVSELPEARLLVADLLLEYIGLNCFLKVVEQVKPEYISCILQINTDESFVFDGSEDVSHPITLYELTKAMFQIHYELNIADERELPDCKKLLQLDYIKA